MLPVAQTKSSPLDKILQAVPQLSQSEKLELIAYLAQQAQQTAVPAPTYYWRDIAGIAPNLLAGQDAQEWVNQTRQEWDREQPENPFWQRSLRL
jgi:hypothetical protein